MNRRSFLAGTALGILATGQARWAEAGTVPEPFDWAMMPPMDDRQAFIDWMVLHRGEDPKFLGQRYDLFLNTVKHRDLFTDLDKRAFLMTPREEFVLKRNLDRAYVSDFLDIGFGVTISGPRLVSRMTSTLAVQKGDRVLEVGTGSGYQSAFLSHLTDQIYTIEIVQPLFERTGGIYADLIARGYTEFGNINRKNDDGYYGWAENAPFDKIIVTCGIDHVPPPLLEQLKPDGIMVIPVGPPGAQHVLRVDKKLGADGKFTVARSDIYHGSVVPFVPFTKLENGQIVGTHNN
jgi:protein-L-isoaspartate(D-aspartate) O-methyltransferase